MASSDKIQHALDANVMFWVKVSEQITDVERILVGIQGVDSIDLSVQSDRDTRQETEEVETSDEGNGRDK